jgi:glycerate-2-kinase
LSLGNSFEDTICNMVSVVISDVRDIRAKLKVSAPSASSNSRYKSAMRVYHEWCESGVQFDFHTWLQREIQRLHSAKAPNVS